MQLQSISLKQTRAYTLFKRSRKLQKY